MELTLPTGADLKQRTANAVSGSREAARSLLGLAADKAQELSVQTNEKAQQLARRKRRKYRRAAKKQARKLEKRLTSAAERLQIVGPPAAKWRARRAALFLILIGAGVAGYLVWRGRRQQDQIGAAEAGPAPDAFGSAVEYDGERARSSSDVASR